MGICDPKICGYQFIYDENDNDYTKIIKYFIMHLMVLCITLDGYVVHMFYEWSFGNNIAVPISIKNNKYFLYLNTYTIIFVWVTENSNKNIT